MSLLNVVHIAGTSMMAQTTRLNVISSNLTNQDSVNPETGEAYKAKQAIFESINQQVSQANNPSFAKGGVRVKDIIESEASLRKEYQPGHPNADESGYVTYSNVNPIEEMANMLAAARSYQDSIQMYQTAKQLMQKTLSSMDVK